MTARHNSNPYINQYAVFTALNVGARTMPEPFRVFGIRTVPGKPEQAIPKHIHAAHAVSTAISDLILNVHSGLRWSPIDPNVLLLGHERDFPYDDQPRPKRTNES